MALTSPNTYYVRFMDDWLVLAKTRNHLRKAIKIAERILARLKLKKHPDKTFIGWIKKGFDFLGYHLTLMGIQLSVKTKKRCVAKIVQLYEQGVDLLRIEKYWQNWVRWAKSGINDKRKKKSLVNHLDIADMEERKFLLPSTMLDDYNAHGASKFLAQGCTSKRLRNLFSF